MSTDFDYSAPVPYMPAIDTSRSWEPAKRHYRDLTDEEKAFNAAHPLHVTHALAETFRATQRPEDLTAWVDAQPIPGQGVLFCDECNGTGRFSTIGTWETCTACSGKGHTTELLFCDEVNSEFRR